MIKYAIVVLMLLFFENSHSHECYLLIKSHRDYGDINSPLVSKKIEKCIDELAAKISKGNSEAIKNGIAVLHVTDGENTLSVKISLAEALSINPLSVLMYFDGDKDALAWICGIPFIEPNDKFVRGYYIKTDKALSHLAQSGKTKIAYRVQLCKKELNKSYKLFLTQQPAQ